MSTRSLLQHLSAIVHRLCGSNLDDDDESHQMIDNPSNTPGQHVTTADLERKQLLVEVKRYLDEVMLVIHRDDQEVAILCDRYNERVARDDVYSSPVAIIHWIRSRQGLYRGRNPDNVPELREKKEAVKYLQYVATQVLIEYKDWLEKVEGGEYLLKDFYRLAGRAEQYQCPFQRHLLKIRRDKWAPRSNARTGTTS